MESSAEGSSSESNAATRSSLLRRLPAVHALIDRPELEGSGKLRGRAAVLVAARAAIAEAREALGRGETIAIDPSSLAARAAAILQDERATLRPVINASGILLHTGLGRAPLAAEAVEQVARIARGYCNLEIDLETGERGRRVSGVAELLKRLTGAEAAAVVNNNAAATVLALKALAFGKEAIVSRGQLVEIGGSFRLPEIFEVAGVRLREVGTTNKTRLADFDRAVGPDTAALLRVHASNYKIVGFVEDVGIDELAKLGRERGLATIDDIGSGAIDATRPPRVVGEPTIAQGLRAGADLVLCSGDKLLGGPQAGLILGSKSAVARLEKDPLMRAFRVDKLILAALEATLRLALDTDWGGRRIPLWSFLNASTDALRERCERSADRIRRELGLSATVEPTAAFLGGGSVPAESIESVAIKLAPPFSKPKASERDLAEALRLGDPAVLSRIRDGAVLLDFRALAESEENDLVLALGRAIARLGE